MKARYLSVVAALLIASSQGCVLPESSYSVTGAVVIEKNPSSVNGGVELSAGLRISNYCLPRGLLVLS